VVEGCSVPLLELFTAQLDLLVLEEEEGAVAAEQPPANCCCCCWELIVEGAGDGGKFDVKEVEEDEWDGWYGNLDCSFWIGIIAFDNDEGVDGCDDEG
jgi:hypothetical protein